MAVKYPLINGNLYSAASAEIDFDGTTYFGIQSISWDEEQESEVVYGTGRVGLGIAEGAYKATGEFEMVLHEADLFLKHLGSGYMSKAFNIGVTFVEGSEIDVSSTKIIGARITKKSTAIQRGPSPSVRKFSFIVVTPIEENGRTAVDTARGGVDAAVQGAISLVNNALGI